MCLTFGTAGDIAPFPVADRDDFFRNPCKCLMHGVPAMLADGFVERDIQLVGANKIFGSINNTTIEFILRIAPFVERFRNIQRIGIESDAQKRIILVLYLPEFLNEVHGNLLTYLVYWKFFHIIDSTGLTERFLYFAFFFLSYGTSTSPSTTK